MSKHYDHILSFALEHPWALTRSMGRIVASLLAHRLAGGDPDPAAIQAALVSRKNLPQPAKGAVALIPIYGVIAPRINMLSEFSGGTTFEALERQLNAAVADPDIKTIVFDVDSPGGNVAGATEFARAILKARTVKPIIAQAHHLMASAAYWAMSCATEIVATPSAKVGAVEVYALYDDISEALAKEGIKRELIFGGHFKPEGVDDGPLSPALRAHIKALCDTFYGYQVADIAKGRGVKESDVRNGFGEGRVVSVDEALALGMIDKIGTLSDTLARVTTAAPASGSLATGSSARAHARAETFIASADVCTACNGSGLKPERFMSDPQGQETCPACNGTGKATTTPTQATLQEPARATSQEPTSDATWQNGIDAALLELDL